MYLQLGAPEPSRGGCFFSGGSAFTQEASYPLEAEYQTSLRLDCALECSNRGQQYAALRFSTTPQVCILDELDDCSRRQPWGACCRFQVTLLA